MSFNIKRFAAGIILLAVVAFSLSYAAFASYDIRILIDGNEIETSEKAIITDGTTLVPMRDIFEKLGAEVSWDEDTRTATGEYGGTVVSVQPDSAAMLKNASAMELSHAPIIENDRILIPLRAVAESFGYNVMWRGSDYTVSITTEKLMNVHFLECGQADSIFIELPDGKCMLADAGEKAFGPELEEFIKEKGYNHLDYVLATHPHSDHIGAMAYIINNFSVGTFYMPDVTHTTKAFEEMLDALLQNGCKCEYVSGGSIIADSVYDIKVLSPQNHSYSKMNNYSAVTMLSYKNVSLLLSADAEIVSEEEIIQSGEDINADVLKIGHHGSTTSTSDAYLEAVNPKDAVISAGIENRYGFPSEQILKKLSDKNINIYRTDTMGNITMTADGYVYILKGDR